MVVVHRLYLDASRRRVVSADDPTAAFLFAIPGDKISDEVAAKYGLLEPTTPPSPKPGPPPEQIDQRTTRVTGPRRRR